MRLRAVTLAALCAACSTEEISVTLPDAPEGTLFAVVNIGDSEAVGRVGSVEALEGPTVRVTEPKSVYVWTYPAGLFGGFRGPEVVYADPKTSREGLDEVRFPSPMASYQLLNGTLEEMADADFSVADDLRIPCDMRSASTRPSFEEDPEPRCPNGARVFQSLVACDELIVSASIRRTVVTDSDMFEVRLSQRGCRIDMTCADGSTCPSWVPMFAVLPPRLAAEGDAAMTSFASTANRGALCRRDDDGRYTCADGSTFIIE